MAERQSASDGPQPAGEPLSVSEPKMTTEPPRENGQHWTAARWWVVRTAPGEHWTVLDHEPELRTRMHGRVIGPIADKATAWKIANAYNGAR